MKGWISLHRKFQENALWKEPRVFSKAEAWIDILMEVQHDEKETETMIKNTLITCNRGQSIKSIQTWAERWTWSRSAIQRFLTLLKRQGMITTENLTKTIRLSVCNYSTYQNPQSEDELKVIRRQSEDELNPDTDNNGNNGNNVNKQAFPSNSVEFKLANYLLNHILQRKPDLKKPKIQTWAKHIDLMIRVDKRNPDNIKRVIQWCQQEEFWQTVILSTSKLRKQFDKLEMKSKPKGQQTTQTIQQDRDERQQADKLRRWNDELRPWVKDSTLQAMQKHPTFSSDLKEPAFRVWAEDVNPIVKEVK